MTRPTDATSRAALQQQVNALKLHGLLAHWDELTDDALTWVTQWIAPFESNGRPASASSAACSGAWAPPISAASSRWPISTGTGPHSVIRPPSLP